MTRTEAATSLAGGAIGGAAAITGLWLTRRWLKQPITAAKPYDQAGAIAGNIGRRIQRRKEAGA